MDYTYSTIEVSYNLDARMWEAHAKHGYGDFNLLGGYATQQEAVGDAIDYGFDPENPRSPQVHIFNKGGDTKQILHHEPNIKNGQDHYRLVMAEREIKSLHKVLNQLVRRHDMLEEEHAELVRSVCRIAMDVNEGK